MSDYNYSKIDPIYNLLLCEEPLYKKSFDFLIEKILEIIGKVNSIGLYAETIDTDIDRTLIDNIISNYINNNNLLNSPLKLINTIGSPTYGTRSIISFNNSDWGYKLLSPYIYDLLSIGGTPQSNLTIVYKNGRWLYVDFNSSDTTLNTPLLEYLNTSGKGNMSNTSPTFLNKDYILKYNGGSNNWSFLEYNTSEGLGTAPINLSNYTWWGKLLSGNTVTGDLKGNISKITFTKTISGTTYNVELGLDSNGNLFVQKEGGGAVDFYSFGGVSALGNSSSGGGGGNLGVVPDLNYLLDYINDNDGYSASPTILNSLNNGDLVLLRVNNSSKFELKSLGSLSSGNGFLLKNGSTFSWGTPSGTLPSTTDQEGNYLYVNSSGLPQWTSISPGGSGGVSSIKYMVSGSSSSSTISGIGDDFTLIKGDNISWDVDTDDKSITLNVPPAGSNALGVVKPGTGLSVDNNGTLDHTNSITAATSSNLYKLKYDAQGHITETESISDLVTVNNTSISLGGSYTITALWPSSKYFTVDEYDGTTAIRQDAGTRLTNGNDDIALRLNQYLSKTITGGAAKIVDPENNYAGITRSIWGQTYCNNGILQSVQGTLTVSPSLQDTSIQSIRLFPNSSNKENPKIYMLNRNIIDYEGIKDDVLQDHLAIGFGATGNNIKLTEIIGNEIRLTSTSGNVYIPNATSITKGLRIGDAIFYWDGNALALIKSDGTACNFYATGGVSALGLSPNSGSGSVDTMTFGNLTVNNKLSFNSSGANIIANQATILGRSSQDINNAKCINLFYDYDNSKIRNNSYYYNLYTDVGLKGETYVGNTYTNTWSIDPDGCAKFSRVYLSDNAYIYFESNNVKLKIGTNTYTLTKQ